MIDLPLSVLLAFVAPAQPRPSVAATPAETVRTTAIDALVIDASVADLVPLEAAVRLRVGACPVSRSDRARQPRAGELFAYLEIEPGEGNRTTLRLTLGDARAWVRTIDAPPEDRTREIATTVGNLFAGILADDIAPDLRDVPLPPPLVPAPPPVVPVRRPPIVAPPPKLEWSLGGDGLVVAGLGPPAPAGLAAGGPALRGGARWRSGALVMGGVRAGVRQNQGYSLTRVRVELAGGYALHRGAFALHTTIGVTVEPWLVTRGGAVPDGSDRRPTGVLLGGALRLAPMGRIALGRLRAHRPSLAIGPFLELAGSAMPGANGGVARLRTSPGDAGIDVFRAGGLELAAGLAVAYWAPRKN